MRSYRATGVILGKKDYSEADKIVCIFTKELGKVFVMAKSARLPKSRKRGSLETFNTISFSASKSKGFDYLSEVQIVDSRTKIKKDLKRIAVAYFLIEVVSRLTREDEPNARVYTLLESSLDDLATTSATKKVKQKFVSDILIELGFWPSGKKLINPELLLEEVAERQFSSARVGKKLLEIYG